MKRIGTIQTYTGKLVNPFEFDINLVSIVDIAHSLSHACRFQGHTSDFYSVAEHSVIMATQLYEECGINIALWALLHDAPETYIGDIPKPLKVQFPGIEEAEEVIMEKIAECYSLEGTFPSVVKELDSEMVYHEAQMLMVPYNNHDKDAFDKRFGEHAPKRFKDLRLPIRGLPPFEAKKEFLELFNFLVETRKKGCNKPFFLHP